MYFMAYFSISPGHHYFKPKNIMILSISNYVVIIYIIFKKQYIIIMYSIIFFWSYCYHGVRVDLKTESAYNQPNLFIK